MPLGREVYELVDGHERQVPVGRHEHQVLVGRDELQVFMGRDGPQMHVVEAHRFTGRDERQRSWSRADTGAIGNSSLRWQAVDADTDVAPNPLPFSHTAGPIGQLPPSPQPIDFFSCLLDSYILQLIVDETNRVTDTTLHVEKVSYSTQTTCTHLNALRN